MWIKFTEDYIAGLISGAGLLLLVVGLCADAGILTADGLQGAGTKFAGLALLLAGGGLKLQSQNRPR